MWADVTADLLTGAEFLQLLLVGIADQHKLLHLVAHVCLLSQRLVHLLLQMANAVLAVTNPTDGFIHFSGPERRTQ